MIEHFLFFFQLALITGILAVQPILHAKSIQLGKRNDLLSPPILLGIVFFLFYVLKPIFVFGNGWYGPGTRESWKHAIDLYYLNLALGVALVGILCFFVGYKIRLIKSVIRPQGGGNIRFGLLYILLFSFCAIGVFTIVYLIKEAGGIGGFLIGLKQRHLFYSERGFVVFILSLPKIIYLIYVYLWLTGRGRIAIVIILLPIILACDLVIGSRSSLLLGTIFPLVGMYHYLRKPIRPRLFIVMSMVFLVLIVSVRVVTRDINKAENVNKTATELLAEKFSDLPGFLIDKLELGMYDSLVTEVTGLLKHGDYLEGKSVARAVLVLPKVLIGDFKPDRGSVAYTKRFYPAFYGPGKSSITPTYIGDWFMNFGLVGVLIGMSLLGMWTRWIFDQKNSEGAFSILIYSIAIGQTALVIRGDIQQVITMLSLVISILFVCWILTKPKTISNPHSSMRHDGLLS